MLDVPKLAVGTRVQDPMLVLEVNERSYGDGSFVVLTLGNASGRIDSAPFWESDRHLVEGVARGNVAQVIGEVSSYRDKRQLKVSSLRVLPAASVDWSSLVPSVGPVDRYWKALDGWRSEIAGPRLRAVLALFYDDDEFRQRYEQCPASPVGHHAMLGGLLQHTVEVAHIGRSIAKVRNADHDLVLAGALLHDIGKLESYRWDGGVFETTDRGYLYGHVVLGSLWLARRVAEEASPPCTPEELDLLQHFILSHHGRGEYGAPVMPMTVEAEILHYADNASAKAASMQDALADDAQFDGDRLFSTKPIWYLDRRRAFRGASDWGLEG